MDVIRYVANKNRNYKRFLLILHTFHTKRIAGSDRFPFTMNVKGGDFLTFEEIKIMNETMNL